MKIAAQRALLQWEQNINAVNTDPAMIKVENKVDLEGPPSDFIYIARNIAGDGVTVPTDPIVGCSCTDCFTEKKKCCGHQAGSGFAYYKNNKRTRLEPGHGIYECNSKCTCGPGKLCSTTHLLSIVKKCTGGEWDKVYKKCVMSAEFIQIE